MTCVWDSLMRGLKYRNNIYEFVNELKSYNNKDLLKNEWANIKCNNEDLNLQMYEENKSHIESIDIKNLNNGYDCSTCDPLLILICGMYCVNIDHYYLHNKISYTNSKTNYKSNKIITLRSNNHHMEFVSSNLIYKENKEHKENTLTSNRKHKTHRDKQEGHKRHRHKSHSNRDKAHKHKNKKYF